MFTITKSIAEQLVDIHLKYETHYKDITSYDESLNYHTQMLDKGVILTYKKEGELLGYVEAWKINFEQFGRLVCHVPFKQLQENITDGKIAYVANTFILPEYRNSEVYKILKSKFFEYTKNCDYYCGVALRKKHQPIKVFTKKEIQWEQP